MSIVDVTLQRRDSDTLLGSNDPLLETLIGARDEESREAALEVIVMTHAHPTARRVVARYRSTSALSTEDAEDIVGTVHLRLVRRLRALTIARDEPIERLEDYVATLTYHVIYDHLRRRFPERMRFKNRLRYTLDRDPRFAIWPTQAGIICGLSEWKKEPRQVRGELRGDWSALRGQAPADAVASVLRDVNAPILLDDLVRALGEVWHIGNAMARSDVTLADLRPGVDSEVEARDFIARLWREILMLPEQQRAALLLNLRDDEGGNAVALLVMLGIATIDAIAAAVGLAPEALAELWNDLPIADQRIGEMLQRTRQQVINLRKSARARLTRRLAKESM